MLSLRFDGESDDEFRARAERALRIAKVLVSACLANRCMLRYIADPSLPYTEESVRLSPTVRVEYEEAIAIGDLGSCLSVTASKRWGDAPGVMPLEPDDEFFPDRVTYIYRTNSLYNRRFEQRRRLKELLEKRLRALVETAQRRPRGRRVTRPTNPRRGSRSPPHRKHPKRAPSLAGKAQDCFTRSTLGSARCCSAFAYAQPAA